MGYSAEHAKLAEQVSKMIEAHEGTLEALVDGYSRDQIDRILASAPNEVEIREEAYRASLAAHQFLAYARSKIYSADEKLVFNPLPYHNNQHQG